MNYTKYWLALSRVNGMGPAHLAEVHRALSEHGLSLIDIADCSPGEIAQELSLGDGVCRSIESSREMLSAVEEDYGRCLEEGISVIPFFSESYPRRLHEVLGNTAPPFIYALSGAEILSKRGAAILGDRDVSEKGELISYNAARELAAHDCTVFSGYARGADQIAHRGSLEAGGTTAALLPCGIFHHAVPRMLMEVFDPERIAVASPFYPTREIDQYAAMARNRILCALARAVYIVEAPDGGGVFEAAKSAHHLKIPLFTTEYAEYPKNAPGNKKIIDELDGTPLRGKLVNDMLVPNMDRIIALCKFE
ncbi:MAG: DNA-processing protein DprA [Spirochaetes bacterium]|nr:DNA-processing protein DprA [Spirochaetota bacterium]